MLYLEIISVRLANPGDGEQIQNIFIEICLTHSKDNGNRDQLVLYKNPKLETDWSVHLLGSSLSPKVDRSKTGQAIFDVFREFGIVNHSIWKHVRSDQPLDKGKKLL